MGVSVSRVRSMLLAQGQSSPPIRSLGLGLHLQNVVMRNALSNAYLSAKFNLNGKFWKETNETNICSKNRRNW